MSHNYTVYEMGDGHFKQKLDMQFAKHILKLVGCLTNARVASF